MTATDRIIARLRPMRLKADSQVDLTWKAGTVVYPCTQPDFGAAATDTRSLGTPCRSMTLDPAGGYPFVVVPLRDMEEAAHDRD